jgi:hypothetical protein
MREVGVDQPQSDSTGGAGDRTFLALVEIAAALVLVGTFFIPWYFIATDGTLAWLSVGSFSPAALTTGDLLTPFVPMVAVVLTLVAFAIPARPARIAVTGVFAAAVWAAALDFDEVIEGDKSGWTIAPGPGPGLWLYAVAAAIALVVAIMDVRRGGSSTLLWRALGRPSGKRVGAWVAYGVALLVTLPVALFPMLPRLWIFVWLAALGAGPLWVIGRRTRARQRG